MPAPAQTAAPQYDAALHRSSPLPYFGAEACDISTVDASPTRTDSGGNALPCRALNAQVAGNVKVDLADGTSGVTLAVIVGANPMSVTKVYKTGTDVGLVGKLAFLF